LETPEQLKDQLAQRWVLFMALGVMLRRTYHHSSHNEERAGAAFDEHWRASKAVEK
jgi:hypothetical protein